MEEAEKPLHSKVITKIALERGETGVGATHLTKGVTVSEKNAILDSRFRGNDGPL